MIDKNVLLNLLYECYLQARRHKRHTRSQMEFEYNLEDNLVKLCDDIFDWSYEISPSIYFVQQEPIKREIFAWNFRDRIVHHLIFDLISPYREKQFIYDSYSCRTWKWTMFGVERIRKFMIWASQNFTKNARILKVDIQWYFMSMDKNILRWKIKNFIDSWADFPWKWNSKLFPSGKFIIWNEFPPFLEKIIYDTIFNDPTKTGIFRWKKSDYIWLPETKSLFYSKPNCGLPIWNLTSQLFSNIYLNDFDHFVKEKLGIKYYGRYVDDFVLIHDDKEFLKSRIPIIRNYLAETVHLKLHPKKIYLQEVKRWVEFLWARIYPYCIHRGRRTIKNFVKMLKSTNFNPSRDSLDSFLWLMMHHRNYGIIYKYLNRIWKENLMFLSDFASSFLE